MISSLEKINPVITEKMEVNLALDTHEWNIDPESPEVKIAAQKLSPQQKFILLTYENLMQIAENSQEESTQRILQFPWGFAWTPAKNKLCWPPGGEWTPSRRASLSKSIARLEQRGLIIRDNHKHEPRMSVETPAPKRTTTVKFTALGRGVAKLLYKRYSEFTLGHFHRRDESALSIQEINKDLEISELRKAAQKLSSQQKSILMIWEFWMQLEQELEDDDFDNSDIYRWGLWWWPSKFYEKSGEKPKDWTASDRADFSRSLKRLENRGLIIRNNHKNAPRASIETPPPKRTTYVKLTELGRKVATWLMKGDHYVDDTKTNLSVKERKQLIERRQKG